MATQAMVGARAGSSFGVRQLGGILAIGGVVLVMVSVIALAGDVPDLSRSPQEVRAWFEDNGQRYLVGQYFIAVGFLLFMLPAMAVVNSMLSEAEGDGGIWSRLSLLGFISYFVVLGVSSGGTVAPGVPHR